MVLALKRTEIDVTDLNDHIHHITLPDSIFRSENYNAIQKPELAIIFANLSFFFKYLRSYDWLNVRLYRKPPHRPFHQ